MRGVSQPPRIKFCGITSLDDARLAVEAGAWAVGLVLWPSSPRRCDLAEAERIAASLRRRVEVAGVFVNATLDEVAAVVDGVGLTMVQLHGDEDAAHLAETRRRLPAGCEVWKAVRVRGGAPRLAATGADRLLLDGASDRAPGGTGTRFDWSLVASHPDRDRIVLAGGLDSTNIDLAQRAGTGMLDLSSGVEESPGRKSATAFTAAAFQTRGHHSTIPESTMNRNSRFETPVTSRAAGRESPEKASQRCQSVTLRKNALTRGEPLPRIAPV